MPNLVARDLLVKLSERKAAVEHHELVIARLENRVQQLIEVNSKAETDINRLQEESNAYKSDRERVLQKMLEFEQRLATYATLLCKSSNRRTDSRTSLRMRRPH
jgi:hypothetical protein